jgi:hypothetical protein
MPPARDESNRCASIEGLARAGRQAAAVSQPASASLPCPALSGKKQRLRSRPRAQTMQRRLRHLLEQLQGAPPAPAVAAAAATTAAAPDSAAANVNNADPFPQMSAAEKFRFDTQGWIRIPGVLSAEELSLLNTAFDENQHLSEDDENHSPLQTNGAKTIPFKAIFMLNMIILPRQAQDKHRES